MPNLSNEISQPPYLSRFAHLRMTRDAEGVLLVEMHTDGGPIVFDAIDHEQFVDAFYEIGRDRNNKVVILTGVGDYMADINFGSFGNVGDANVWSKVHDEGTQILENIANIRVPLIAAIEGRAHIHTEYALLANVVVAGRSVTFNDLPHFAGGIVPGDGIFTTWSYRAGAGRTESFLLNPEPISAQDGCRLGCRESCRGGRSGCRQGAIVGRDLFEAAGDDPSKQPYSFRATAEGAHRARTGIWPGSGGRERRSAGAADDGEGRLAPATSSIPTSNHRPSQTNGEQRRPSMSLQSELDTFKNAWLERVGPDTAKLVDQDNLALQALADNALRAGDRFPAIVLRNQLGEDIDLGELAKTQPLVVTFYRGGWCPYCNLELRAYQKALPEIEALWGKAHCHHPRDSRQFALDG